MANSNINNALHRSGYHHGDLRAELVRAGIQLLETTGAAEFSLREVARTVGVSASAPYRHFHEKGDLLEAIAAEGYRRLTAVVGTPGAVVGEAAREMEAFALGHPAWWEVMIGRGTDSGGELEEARSGLLAELVGVVDRSGRRRDSEAAIRGAVAVWAGVVGLVRLRTGGALMLLDAGLVPGAAEFAEAAVSVRRSRSVPSPRQRS